MDGHWLDRGLSSSLFLFKEKKRKTREIREGV
jgi:hypothetical protein